MKMLQSPTNKVIVQVKNKWIKHFSDLAKRASIENGSTVDPTEAVNIVGEVISLPKLISPTKDYKGYSTKDIKVGDTAIFSYRVIHDFIPQEIGADPVYKNLLSHEGKEYFLADITNIFGVIRDGEIIMINGHVMITEYEKAKIIIPNSQRKTRECVCSEVISIGHSRTHLKGIDAETSDKVYFNERHAQHYEMNGKKFLIVSQEKILGKKSPD